MKDIEKVSLEIQQSKDKYDCFNSTHEVYGVLIEEVDEFWELVKRQTLKSDDPMWFESLRAKKLSMIHELTQIAAISLRAIDELRHDKIKWV